MSQELLTVEAVRITAEKDYVVRFKVARRNAWREGTSPAVIWDIAKREMLHVHGSPDVTGWHYIKV